MSAIIILFRKLLSVNDVPTLRKELDLYSGEESKYFKTLIQNLGDDLSKYKYVFDLILKINRENPKTTFHDIYFKFLSTNNFQRYRNFHFFLNKLVLEDVANLDSLVYSEEDNDSNYNSIITGLDIPSGVKLIQDFLSQRSLNFEEYYYQKYLSTTEKLKNTLENEYNDVNELYYRYPWFTNAVVSKVYIASTEHDIDLFISNSLTPIVHKGKTWYKPNTLFYSYISNQNHVRTLKSSNDGIATLEFLDDKSKVQFSFHILYKLFKNDFNFTYLILDESIFNMEKKFLNVDYDSHCDEYHVNMFLDDNRMYSQSNIDLVIEFFNKAMANVLSSYKITNATSILKLPSLKNIRTLRELARKIAEITVFLHLDSVSNSIFKKQIIRNYYQQNMLFDLKFEEKLPELLYDVEHTDTIVDFLNDSIESEIFNIGESVYRLSRKSMFKQLTKKRTYPPLIRLKYIDEPDDHNYIYYDKKEKWLNIKDVLSRKVVFDDEYISDVIQPRMTDIFSLDDVMKKSITKSEFLTKYNLLFHLLEDIMSTEDIYENHKDLFLHYPDPAYNNDDDDGLEISEVAAPDVVTPDVVTPITPPPPQVIIENPPVTTLLVPVSSVIETPAPPVVTAPPPPAVVDVPNYFKDHDTCSNCGLNSRHQCTTTFIHKSDNMRSTRCITICYNCLEKNTLSDD